MNGSGGLLVDLLVASLLAIPVYGAAVAATWWLRGRDGRIRSETARMWGAELSVTTVVLAAPGLIAAFAGMWVLIGLIPFVFGVATLVVATRVSRDRPTRAHPLPLAFVVVVDVLAVWWAIVEIGNGSYGSGVEVWTPVLAAYLALATWNAARILNRGTSQALARDAAESASPTVIDRLLADRDAAAEDAEVAASATRPGTFEPPTDLFRDIAAGRRVLD